MREILFRGKRESDGKWLYGLYSDDYVYDTGFPCIMPLRSEHDDGDWSVIPETVGQFTGLKDKNGKKIFEGDILESRYDEKHFEDACCEVVLWYDNGWCIQEDGCADLDHLSEDDMLKYSEVIGNIHDNPELLKGEGK